MYARTNDEMPRHLSWRNDEIQFWTRHWVRTQIMTRGPLALSMVGAIIDRCIIAIEKNFTHVYPDFHCF